MVDEKPEVIVKTVCDLPWFDDYDDEVVKEMVEEVVEHEVQTTKVIVEDVEEIIANVPDIDIKTKPEVIVKTVCDLPWFDDYDDEVV